MKVLTKGMFFTFFLIFLITELITSCAKEAMPLGGPKDTIPPQIIWSYPQPYQKNFKDNKIIIKFDEYFVLKNLSKEFFVSPPFGKPPAFRIRGKKLIVALKDTLRDSVTYTMEFGNAITDFTEGNVLENYKLVFSTYDKIDSLRVSGKVLDAFTREPLEGIYVMLYKKRNDSVIYQEPPQYVTVTNKQGRFTIVGIKEGCYKMVAINDLNFNFKYDGIENQIAFVDSLICPKARMSTDTIMISAGTILHSPDGKIIDTLKQDSTIIKQIVKYLPDSLTLNLFTENTSPQQVINIRRVYPFLAILRFNYPLHDNFYKIYPLMGQKEDYMYNYFPEADTLNIWITNPNIAQVDSLAFIVQYYTPIKGGKQLQTDTIILPPPLQKDYKLTLTPKYKEINPFDSLILYSNVLIKRYDKSNMQLVQVIDTSLADPKEVKINILRTEPNEIDIFFSKPLVKKFDIQLTDLPDKKIPITVNNDSTKIQVKLPEEIAKKDTVRITFSYWIERFFGYNEFYRKKLNLVLTRQELLKTERTDWQTVILKFSKPIRNFSLTGIQADTKLLNDFTIELKLHNPSDTVEFNVKTLDFQNLGVEPIYFESTITSIYNWNPNRIIRVARPTRGQVIMEFSRPPLTIKSIDCVDPKVQGKLNTYQLDSNILKINFESKEFKRLKINKIVVGFEDLNRNQKVLLYDTVEAEIGQNPFLKKTTIYKPETFGFNQDKQNPLQFYITNQFESKSKYKFLVFTNSLTDIMNKENDSIYVIEFKTTDVEQFGTIKLNFTDLTPGLQLIVQLLDDKGNVIKEISTTKSEITLNKVNPGEYKLRIIFDKNKNNRWDTGNYLRKEQPEKVIVLPKKITAKPNWQIEETISIKELEKM